MVLLITENDIGLEFFFSFFFWGGPYIFTNFPFLFIDSYSDFCWVVGLSTGVVHGCRNKEKKLTFEVWFWLFMNAITG